MYYYEHIYTAHIVCKQTAKNVVAIRNVEATPKILQHAKRVLK